MEEVQALKGSGPSNGWHFPVIDCDFMAFSFSIKFRMNDHVLKADQPYIKNSFTFFCV